MDDKLKSEVRNLSLESIRGRADNPRTIAPANRQALRNSLERFGLVDTLVVNLVGDEYQLVSGHQRLALLREAGVQQAPCMVLNLPEAEAHALALTMNNPAAQGEWTDDLEAQIRALRDQMDIGDLGLDRLLSEMESQEPEEIQKVTIQRPIKQVWVLVGIPADRYLEHAETFEELERRGMQVHVRAD